MKKQVAILGLTLMIGATAFAANPSSASAKKIHSVPKAMRGTWYTYDWWFEQYSVLKISSTGVVWKQLIQAGEYPWFRYDLKKFTVSKSGWVRASTGHEPFYFHISKNHKPYGHKKQTALQVKFDTTSAYYMRKKIADDTQKKISPLP